MSEDHIGKNYGGGWGKMNHFIWIIGWRKLGNVATVLVYRVATACHDKYFLILEIETFGITRVSEQISTQGK